MAQRRRTTARELDAGAPTETRAEADEPQEAAASGRAGDDEGEVAPPVPPRGRAKRRKDGEYGPDRLRPLHEQGLVATRHWIGRVGGKRVHILMGAPKKTIPAAILEEALMDGLDFQHAEPEPGTGAVIIRERPTAPRARRDPPRKEPERRFAPVRSSISSY